MFILSAAISDAPEEVIHQTRACHSDVLDSDRLKLELFHVFIKCDFWLEENRLVQPTGRHNTILLGDSQERLRIVSDIANIKCILKIWYLNDTVDGLLENTWTLTILC